MNRRSLFKILTSAIVASSMEVMGWKPVTILNPVFKYQLASMIRNLENNVIELWEDRPATARTHDGKRFEFDGEAKQWKQSDADPLC